MMGTGAMALLSLQRERERDNLNLQKLLFTKNHPFTFT